MSTPRTLLPRLFRSAAALRNSVPSSSKRAFSSAPRHAYDGVYNEIRIMKLQKPWLQALAEKETGIPASVDPEPVPQEKLTPKRMNDSYHELVLSIAAPPLPIC